jgi:hypothetical protein
MGNRNMRRSVNNFGILQDVAGEDLFIYEEAPVFELEPPYDIEDSILAPLKDLTAIEGKASCDETIDKSRQQKRRYPEYYGKVVRLGIDIQTLEYFASKKIMMTNSDHNNNNAFEDLNLVVQNMKERVGEEYPKHTDPKKQQPGKNVITPIIAYATQYHSYLQDPTNPNLQRYKRYEYIYNNFEYLTGIAIEDLYTEEMERVVENRKTARRIEMDSVIGDVKPPAFAQFITDKLQEFFPVRDYNRAIKLLTEYFGDKFDILPESIKALFLHVISAADAAAKPTEQDIKLAQMAVNGLLDVSDTKKANKRRISDSVAQNPEMKRIALKCREVLDQMKGESNNK